MEFGIVELSRLQFAMTAMYHFLFVPLTLGLSILVAIMETVYVMTNRPIWRQMTKFWGTLFGINFVLGVATGITMEFQFGMNWSYYSHYVGDIFGAPLAIEGLERAVMAFEQQLDVERRAPADAQDDSAGKLALARAIAGPSTESELVRITSERAQRRYGALHIRARVAQVDEVQQRLGAVRSDVHATAAAVLAQARAHGWLPPSWLARIDAVHMQRCAQVDALAARLSGLHRGFASLPRLAEDTSEFVPTPVSWQD